MDQAISLDTVIKFLTTTPQLAGLDQAERAEVVRIMEVQRFQGGEVLFSEGDAADAWYVVFEGRAEVLKGRDDPKLIATLEAGACLGEMAILDGSARSATVRAAGPLTVFRFRRPLFEELLADGSLAAFKLVLTMARALSMRQRNLTAQLHELMQKEQATGQSVRDEVVGMVDRMQLAQ